MWIGVAVPRFDPVTLEPIPGASPQAYIVAGMMLNVQATCTHIIAHDSGATAQDAATVKVCSVQSLRYLHAVLCSVHTCTGFTAITQLVSATLAGYAGIYAELANATTPSGNGNRPLWTTIATSLQVLVTGKERGSKDGAVAKLCVRACVRAYTPVEPPAYSTGNTTGTATAAAATAATTTAATTTAALMTPA
eukprot:9149-Heterococcus_DN1.PRE.1